MDHSCVSWLSQGSSVGSGGEGARTKIEGKIEGKIGGKIGGCILLDVPSRRPDEVVQHVYGSCGVVGGRGPCVGGDGHLVQGGELEGDFGGARLTAGRSGEREEGRR